MHDLSHRSSQLRTPTESKARLIAGAFVVFVAILQIVIWDLPRLVNQGDFISDACQHVWWTYRFADPTLFPNDPIATMFSSRLFAPLGFRTLYRIFTPLIDAQVFSELISVPVIAVTAWLYYSIGVSAARGNNIGGVVALVVAALMQDPFRMLQGGLQRNFAAPLLLIGLLGALKRRPTWLGVALLLSALLYPPMVVNLALMAVMLAAFELYRRRRLGRQWIVAIVFAAAGAAVLIDAQLHASPPGMGPIVTVKQARAMAEFGPEGRIPFFSGDWRTFYFTNGLSGVGYSWIIVAGIAAMVGVTAIACRRLIRLEFWLLILSGAIAFALAHALLFHLYVPNRFARYPMVIFTIAWVAAFAGRAWIVARRHRRIAPLVLKLNRPVLWSVIAAVVLLLFADRLPGAIEQTLHPTRNEPQEAMLAYLRTLPADTLVAAYPRDANAIPIRAHLSVIANHETDHPFWLGFHAQMQLRLEAELAATYASDWADVDALRTRFGADVFVMNRDRLVDQASIDYYAPAREANQKRVLANARHGFVLDNPPPERILFQCANYTVIRLIGPKGDSSWK